MERKRNTPSQKRGKKGKVNNPGYFRASSGNVKALVKPCLKERFCTFRKDICRKRFKTEKGRRPSGEKHAFPPEKRRSKFTGKARKGGDSGGGGRMTKDGRLSPS